MMISTKGRYALRIMIDLAQHDGETPVSVREIAERQEISGKYMEQIISVLTRAGLLRSVRGISQVELGEKLNVSKQSISNWENGNLQPSIEMLMKIADFFSVSTDFLLGLDNRTSIIVDGLSTEELSHIRVIIDDLVAAKRRMGIEQNDDRPRE